MTSERIKIVLPYAGLPILCAAILILQINRVEVFYLLSREVLVIFGYIAAVSDIKTKKIPNTLILYMLGGWIILIVPQLMINTQETLGILKDSAIGFALAGGLFLLVYLISRKGLGGGDVKFMACAGLYLGFNGALPAMLYGTVLAGIAGLLLILLKKINRKDAIPLAPFLCAGILITVFFR